MAVDTSTIQVVMPAMGDSVAEGTVLEWHKEEGDTVAADGDRKSTRLNSSHLKLPRMLSSA